VQLRSEADPKFFLRYTDVWVGEPSVEDESFVASKITPFQCRLRCAPRGLGMGRRACCIVDAAVASKSRLMLRFRAEALVVLGRDCTYSAPIYVNVRSVTVEEDRGL
jgi:hypothetical protein